MTPTRNAPCPCGSQKKYKHCCLAKQQSTAPRAAMAITARPSLPQQLQQARGLHEQGRLVEAENRYRAILQQDRNHFDAQHLLGVVLYQRGHFNESLQLLKKLSKRQPQFADLHSNLGLTLLALNKPQAALTSFNKAVSLNPDTEKFLLNVAVAQEQLGMHEAADQQYQKAQQCAPGSWYVLQQHGAFWVRQGDLQQAALKLQAALAIAPPSAALENSLGSVLLQLGHWDSAASHLLNALKLAPQSIDTLNNLANLHHRRGDCVQAIERYRQALAIAPGNLTIMLNLLNPLLAQGNLAQITPLCEQILRQDPHQAQALYYLAQAAMHAWDFAGAEQHYRACCQANPTFIQAKHNLAMLLADKGLLPQAITLLDEAVALNDQLLPSAQNRVALSNYDPGVSAQQVWEMHRRFAQRHLPDHIGAAPSDRAANPERKTRVGFISSDFRNHSVSFFIEPILQHYQRDQFEIFCYYNDAVVDATTERLMPLADHWNPVYALDDQQLAATIAADRLDLLIDLNGHTTGNRLGALALRPAPVMATYLGYPNTTGMAQMDYRIVDRLTDPLPAAQQFASEQLYHLPRSFLCYQPPAEAPAIEARLNTAEQPIRFCSFNNISKITPDVIQAWAQILLGSPDATLLLKSKQLAESATLDRLKSAFATRGVDPDRIECQPATRSIVDHLAQYNRADIALDTFPYNGTTTTCEALWMGVPVVCITGDRHAARVSHSLLHQIGAPELVAESSEAYVALAIALAANRQAQRRYKETLRQALHHSALGDGEGFTREFEMALREMIASKREA